MEKPKLIIFASGKKEPFSEKGGGSGATNLKRAVDAGILKADIVAFVSNNENGGVRYWAEELGVPFEYFPKPWTGARYEEIMRKYDAKYTALSGWLKLAVVRRLGFWGSLLRLFGFNSGLDPRYTFNIHPALLSQLEGIFGGPGMYGHHVHEAVAQKVREGKIWKSGFSMHFVTERFDDGPVFAQIETENLGPLARPDQVGQIVNALEHEWQPKLTNMVVSGEISWDGIHRESLRVPEGFKFLPPES